MAARPPNSDLPAEGFIKIATVLRVFPVSKTVWYEGIKAGRYPKPVKLTGSSKAAAWRVSDIRGLIERMSAQGG
ncbi:MAG TPA: AlpA family phage regulatory protein [Povalibacter sp.]|uniref:helix-turn-helix transcriptional regulator n=1 Tax=Povalibacter sp. TaxID=1962978 RepID=UPI002B55E1B3|nr:AlpA family phage regulatory protein [Povalibacter sp.]HMN42945.1 AlpA family phage regulatory protein [Povalibacter sp.]